MKLKEAKPFTIDVPDAVLDRIHARVTSFEWNDFPDAGGWSAGADVDVMRRLADYWVSAYDWRACEARLNALNHFTVEIEGLSLHFILIKGSGDSKRPPVLLCHGWPGSFLEFEEAAERLAYPARFGGQAQDGLDLVIPSLPGYIFSGRPSHPMPPRVIAGLFHRLMVEVLGYKHYVAQGGDWGSLITSWIAHDYAEACVGLHLNMVLARTAHANAQTEEERAHLKEAQRVNRREGGYSHLQSTRPQTLAFALKDSPIGVAAWIIEKFAAWSDLKRVNGVPNLFSIYTADKLLTNVMLYVVTGSIATSIWLYKALANDPSRTLEHRIAVPTGIAAFPDPVFSPPPQSYVAQSYEIIRWTPMAKGGHFAALEQPVVFSDDVRAFVTNLCT